MTVYNQRIKFTIILGVLFLSILCVILYNNNLSSKINYVEKRINYLDNEILEGSMLSIKIENAFSKYNIKKSELDFFNNPLKDKKELEDKIRELAKNNDVKINNIIIKEADTFTDKKNIARIEKIPFTIENVEVNAVGNFLDVGLFLEKIIKDSKNLNLNKCDFILDQYNDRQVKADIEFYTYYMEKI